MSHVTRPKPTYMLVCDLCGEEIDKQQDGEWSRGNIICGVSPIQRVTNLTHHALLLWPRARVRRDDKRPAVSYDFHGTCIAALVKDAMAQKAHPATTKDGSE